MVMNKNTSISVIIALLFVGGAWYFSFPKKEGVSSHGSKRQSAQRRDGASMMDGKSMMGMTAGGKMMDMPGMEM